MKSFEFSIRAGLKRAWSLYKAHWKFFLCLAAIFVVCNLFARTHGSIISRTLMLLVSLLWGYVGMSTALAAVDGKTQLLRFDSIKLHLPSFVRYCLFVGLTIASGLFIGAGFILVIIPGFYFMVKLMFANFVFVDKGLGIIPSMRYSWRLMKGDYFWTALLGLMVAALLVLVGSLFLGIGLLVTYPVAILFLAILYRDLVNFIPHSEIAVQLKEIPPTTA